MTGGGTAGHINPAIAIANTIKKNIPDAEIAFVGTERGLENKLVPKENYPLYHVDVRGFERPLVNIKNVKAAYLALVSPMRAKKLIREFRPDIVIGTGGYACWPVLKAAASMGIPTAVHESNATPGLAISKLQGCVDRIFVNFKQTAEHLSTKDKVMHVGNPLRSGFGGLDYSEARKKLGIEDDRVFVLSFGGSLGARRLNESALSFMSTHVKGDPKMIHYHATGAFDFKEFSESFKGRGLEKCPNIRLVEYIHDMALRMSAADIVICRAGAMTISEIAMMKKACIMIPSPNVVDNHQYKNAKVLSDAGAVVMLEEAYLNEETFSDAIISLASSREKREELSKNIGEFANSDANKLIYNEVIRLAKRGANNE